MSYFEGILAVGGTTALSIVVLYLLYKEMIKRDLFSRMSSNQTFVFFSFLAVLIFLVVNIAFDNPLQIAIGSGITQNQGN